MTSLILLLALAITGAAAIGSVANKEYMYKYETQAVTGVPHHAIEYAGSKIKATVKIQVKTDNRVTLKMEEVAIYKIQMTLKEVWPESGLLPESELTAVDAAIVTELKKELVKPVQFTYRRGEVEDLRIAPDEALWSVNIKKGLISTMKLKLREEGEIMEDDQPLHEDPKRNIPEKSESEHGMMKSRVYSVMEIGVSGICESIYGIEKNTAEEGAANITATTTMRVTKVRNFDRCAKAPIYEQGLISGLTITTEPLETKDIIEKTTQADYELKGSRMDFVIKKVRQDSKFILTPMTPKDGSVVTSIVQVLTLEQEKTIEVAIQPKVQLSVRPEGLLYVFPVSSVGKDMTLNVERDEHAPHIEALTADQTTTAIESILQKTIPMMIPTVKQESIDNIKIIGALLKRLSVEEMIALCEKYLNTADNKDIRHDAPRREHEYKIRNSTRDWERRRADGIRNITEGGIKTEHNIRNKTGDEAINRRTEDDVRTREDRKERLEYETVTKISTKAEIILDLIPTLTSPKTLPVIVKLLTKGMISPTRASMSIKIISMMVTPDMELMKFLDPHNTEYSANPVIINNKYLKHTVYMTTGTIWSRYVRAGKNAGVPTKELTHLLQTQHGESLKEIFKKSDKASKVALLKSFGNSGYPGFITVAEEVIANKSEDIQVRTNALYIFRKMNEHTMKRRIQSILTTVYMDLTEKPKLRMGAFVALMDTKPEIGILNMITRVQRKEKTFQVGSFVYSYLSTLAKATLPGFYELAFNIRRILPLVRPINPKTSTESKGVHIDYLCKFADMGAGLEVFKLNDGKTMTPSTLVSRVLFHTMGKTMTVLEAGIHTKGVDEILSKLMGTHKGLMESVADKPLKEVIEAILIPLQSGDVKLGEVKEEIKSVIEKLGIADRPSLEKLNIEFFLSIFGNDITLIDITAEDVLNWVKTGTIPHVGKVEEIMKELTAGGNIIDIIKVINLGTSTIQIPSAAGIPVSFNFTATSAVHMKGNVALKGSSLLDILKPAVSGNVPTEIGVETSVKISHSHAWVAAMGADIGLIKTGVGLKGTASTNYPITFEVKANTKTYKLSTSLELPTEGQETVNVKIEPTAFVTIIDPTKPVQNRKLTTIPLTHPSRVELLDVTIPATLPVLNAKITTKYINPVTLPKWMPISWLWAPSAMIVNMAPITSGPASKIELEIDSTTEEARLKEILPKEVTVHPIVTDPMGVKIALKAGMENNTNSAKAELTLITSKDMKKTQVTFLVKAPTVIPSPFMTELVLDLEGLSTRTLETMSPTTVVGELKMTLDTKTVTVKALPAGADKITWKKYEENNFFNLIELFTKEKITSKVTKAATMKPPELNYKLEIDTNVNLSEMTKFTTAVTTAIVTTSYIALAYPSIPVSFENKISPAPSKLEGQMKVTPMFEKVDIVLKTTAGEVYGIELPGCIYDPLYKLLPLETPIFKADSEEIPEKAPVAAYYHGYPMDTPRGKCAVYGSDEEDTVKTFDKYTYNLPSLPSSCEVVLAKDCSELSLFTVLMKPVEETKILKVLIPRHKVEIVPETSWFSSAASCKVIVDGSEISVTESSPETLTGERDETSEFGEVSTSGDWVTVKLTTVGLTVSTDGKEVFITTSPFMRSHVCGLCGNFNDERWDELEGPDMSRHTTAEEMISRYVVPSPSCPISEVRDQFGIEDEPEVTCTPIEGTLVIERDDKTCFSKIPVPVCPTGCRPMRIDETTTIPFICKSTNSYKARRYIEEAREDGIIEELKYKPVDTRIEVEIPETCSPRN